MRLEYKDVENGFDKTENKVYYKIALKHYFKKDAVQAIKVWTIREVLFIPLDN